MKAKTIPARVQRLEEDMYGDAQRSEEGVLKTVKKIERWEWWIKGALVAGLGNLLLQIFGGGQIVLPQSQEPPAVVSVSTPELLASVQEPRELVLPVLRTVGELLGLE